MIGHCIRCDGIDKVDNMGYCRECIRSTRALGYAICDCGCGERVQADAVLIGGWWVNPGHEGRAVAALLI